MSTKKILLIDDDEISNLLNQMVIQITDPSIELIVFSNAVEALKYLEDHSDSLPDLIFLDINMPVMNGWSFAEKCKSKFPNLKIAVLSSSDDPDDILKIVQFPNIIQYVLKPISVDSYVEVRNKI